MAKNLDDLQHTVLDQLATACTPPNLPRVRKSPPLTGVLRRVPEDFCVDECLGFTPTGEGEHLLLRVRKTGQNTRWVLGQLASRAGIQRREVGYAGLKDRHAIAEQWFSLRLPKRRLPETDWSGIEGVQILEHVWHRKRLRPGAPLVNRFRIRLRETRGSRTRAEACLRQLKDSGVPNFFGEQRFGRDGANLFRSTRAHDRFKRSMALSALRSGLFNVYLAERVNLGDWNVLLEGEVPFHGASGYTRLGPPRTDMHGTTICGSGPLWGVGTNASAGEARRREERCLHPWRQVTQRLEQAQVRLGRRALVSWPQDLQYVWEEDCLVLDFSLARGEFATVVLRELVEFDDAARKSDRSLDDPDAKTR